MTENRIVLTINDIYNKEFKIDTNGFKLEEVDEFLDIIIGDYDEFLKILDENKKEQEQLQDEIMSLKQEIRNLKTNIEIASTSPRRREVTNVDVMKRLSELERIVYGKDNEE